MVDWCPRCGARLAPDTQKCPRCGKQLRRSNGSPFTIRDVIGFSATILGYMLIPMVIIFAVALLCILLTR